MKSHGASLTVLLLRGRIKSKSKTSGANEVGSNMKSMKYLRRTTTKTFPLSIFSSGAQAMLITVTTVYTSSKAVPTAIDLHPAAAQNRPCQSRVYPGVRGWQH
jgi:hypothetical protein